jgi:hypothetical protein|tara:strand:+ start:656 stop:844 length:189 start_codon:yes stop_codon:yes gene_type:complete
MNYKKLKKYHKETLKNQMDMIQQNKDNKMNYLDVKDFPIISVINVKKKVNKIDDNFINSKKK